MKKCTIVLILVLIISCMIPTSIFATDGITTITEGMKGVQEVGANSGTKMRSVINSVIKLIQMAGTGISVVMVTMLGIKYMLASAGEKADIKKQAVPIIVGCVILFAAVSIVGLVADIGEGLNGTSSGGSGTNASGASSSGASSSGSSSSDTNSSDTKKSGTNDDDTTTPTTPTVPTTPTTPTAPTTPVVVNPGAITAQ